MFCNFAHFQKYGIFTAAQPLVTKGGTLADLAKVPEIVSTEQK